ncbi:hypothetical protein BCCH1_07500 [Burkholderia contaminans]|uniref:Uncharacterized protein n=1 Tax=Burkholderia contaminans TaxID=488447 RepID=A0A286P681_9BURK|nr:hypothetical protein BCCH1_07500 [Burkholderia contaminans]GLZ68104.1 hypothetical protein Bcon01_11490 [Burkholderia contaminans]
MTASVVRYRPDEVYAGSPAEAPPAGIGADNACRLISTLDGFAQETNFPACVVPTRIRLISAASGTVSKTGVSEGRSARR